MKVQITFDQQDRNKNKLIVDGVDLTNVTRELDFHLGPGDEIPTLHLVVYPHEVVVNGEMDEISEAKIVFKESSDGEE